MFIKYCEKVVEKIVSHLYTFDKADDILKPDKLHPIVFPNPTNGKFTVKSDSEGFTDVTVFDIFGNEMVRKRFVGSVEIDASNWAAGVYVVNYGVPIRLGKVVKLVKF